MQWASQSDEPNAMVVPPSYSKTQKPNPMQLSSKHHKRRAMAFARLARIASTEQGKQLMLTQQKRFEGLARVAAKREAEGKMPGR